MNEAEVAGYYAELCVDTNELYFPGSEDPGNVDRVIGYFPSLTEAQSESVQAALQMKARQYQFFYFVNMQKVSTNDAASIYAQTEWKQVKDAHSKRSKEDVEKLDTWEKPFHEMIIFTSQVAATFAKSTQASDADIEAKPNITVYDEARKRDVLFNPNEYRYLGEISNVPAEYEWALSNQWSVWEYYQHGEKAIVIRTDVYGETEAARAYINVTPLREAVEALLLNTQPIPDDLQHLVVDAIFDPDQLEAVSALKNEEGDSQTKPTITVYNEGKGFLFDPNEYQHLGDISVWIGDVHAVEQIDHSYYKHGGKALVITTEVQGETGMAADPVISAVPLKEALEALLLDNQPIPDDLRPLVADAIFDPDQMEVAVPSLVKQEIDISKITSQLDPEGREVLVLTAMLEKKINNPVARKKQDEILLLALGSENAGNDHRRVFGKLSELKLIEKGKNGRGFYLSKTGKKVAEEINRAFNAP